MSDKNQVLEPITAVARLITLVFKKKGTKIAIRKHNLVLCEPEIDTYYGLKMPQAVERYINGDSREDIFVLNHVIYNFIMWYIIPNKSKNEKLYNGLINLAKYLRVSFKQLQNTYKRGTAVGTLQYFINVLTNVIDDNFHPDQLFVSSPSIEHGVYDDDSSSPEDLMYSTILDVNKFKHFWNSDDLLSLCTLFSHCFKNPGEPENALFGKNSFDTLEQTEDVDEPEPLINITDIDTKSKKEEFKKPKKYPNPTLVEKKLELVDEADIESETLGTIETEKEIITDPEVRPDSELITSTEHDQHSHKLKLSPRPKIKKQVSLKSNSRDSWPIPKNQKRAIIEGYLVGIVGMLTIADKRFRLILSTSVKGVH